MRSSAFFMSRIVQVLCVGLVLGCLAVCIVPASAQESTPQQSAESSSAVVPEGYGLVAESPQLQLYMNEQAQIAVRDRRSSRVWLSTPPGSQSEEIEKRLRANFASSFFAYFTRGQGTQVRRENSVTKVTAVSIDRRPNGAVVRYELGDIGVKLALRYELTDDHLDVFVDEAEFVESEDSPLVGLELLPYLGAMPHLADTSAYFVLPDGPGVLTYVGGDQPGSRKKFSAASYGPHLYSFAQPSEQRTPLSACGIVQPTGAILLVVTAGAGDTSTEASISHSPNTYTRLNVRFVYRRVIGFPQGKGVFTPYYQPLRVEGDRALRYYFLAGAEADWVGLAQRLRGHLQQARGVPRLSGPSAEAALRLRLIMGAEKPGLFGRRFATATTFEEVPAIVSAFGDAGMTNLDVVLRGWENDGFEGNLPRRWPPDRHLGGKKGLEQAIDAAHSMGARLFLEGDYTLAFLRNGGFLPLTDVMTQPNLLPTTDMVSYGTGQEVPRRLTRNRFFLNLAFATGRYLEPEMKRLAEMGVDGLELRWVGELLMPDANPRHPMERTEATEAWRRMLRIVSDTMGSVASQGGNDYVLGAADTVVDLPLYPANEIFADEIVPFYPIATHGLARLYGGPTNLDDDPRRDFLARLEYGMLPLYELTFRDAIVLARSTYTELYSSRYLDWIDPAKREYLAAVDQLGHVTGQFIVGHRRLAPGVFETAYEDGTRVVVNYSERTYSSEDGDVDGLGYLIVRRQQVEMS